MARVRTRRRRVLSVPRSRRSAEQLESPAAPDTGEEPDEVDPAQFQAAIEEHRRRSGRALAAICWTGLIAYVGVMLLFGVLATGSFDPARFDWTGGMGSGAAINAVAAAVALVAAVTIASATSTPPTGPMNVFDEVGWKRWLDTLSSAAFVTSVLAIGLALTQVARSLPTALMLLGLALVAAWVTSGLYVRTSDRVESALRALERRRKEEILDRLEAQASGLGVRSVRREYARALVAITVVCAVPGLLYGVVGVPGSGEWDSVALGVLVEGLEVFVLLLILSTFVLTPTLAAWSARARRAAVVTWAARATAVLALVASVALLVLIATESEGTWVAAGSAMTVAWAVGVVALMVVRRAPVVRAVLASERRQALIALGHLDPPDTGSV